MATPLVFKIQGTDDAIKWLKLLEVNTRERVKAAMVRGTLEIAGIAKEKITDDGHIVTGTLKRSIRGGAGFVSTVELQGFVGTDVEYAKYVEALPDGGFLFWSLERNAKRVLEYVQDEIKALIR